MTDTIRQIISALTNRDARIGLHPPYAELIGAGAVVFMMGLLVGSHL
ncbi:hypothetical protein HH800_05845 [Sphingobium yanoikuyae]|uniref:Uncharacterized protein n=1 Tax=Sphingobium yanoikuyae TaxID=13690 RepID=A0A6M4G3T8_SPHYA|nr:hypothetical protein [Sphingobium yanoikuyae]QJR01759.1 hypothetical protein HH800_05845 [Sphingobium yanoikuyae]